jgi:hypothetical protein
MSLHPCWYCGCESVEVRENIGHRVYCPRCGRGGPVCTSDKIARDSWTAREHLKEVLTLVLESVRYH